jgi:signal transduction histidine kinase
MPVCASPDYSREMVDGLLDFQLIFEESPDVLLVLLPDSPRFTQIAATRARLAATQTTREQTIGHGLFELFPDNPDDPGATGARNLRASLERVLATRAADTMAVQKYDIRGPDGTFQVRHWSPKNIPILSPSGDVMYIFHCVEDVTELVQASELGEELRDRSREMEREVIKRSRELAAANNNLRDANARLGQLDAAKTAFFSNVSHEFRTPLTLMLGPLEDALADTTAPLAPAQRARLGLAHDNSLRLLKLVNALLDFARLEAGRLRASYAPVDVAGLTAELAGMFQSATAAAGVSLKIDCPPLGEPAWIDRDMWEKIVPNLVSNAFKFTLAGEIAVRVRAEFDSFVFEVADTGCGIPEAELENIFNRFHRVPGTHGRTHEGSGIGLSLVRELVELHGGRVSVTSTVGRGTTFHIEIPKGFAHLPAEAVSQQTSDSRIGGNAKAHAVEAERWARGAAASAAPAPSVSEPATDRETPRPRVLVVDDNADLREYVAALLAPGYDVATASDGEAAIAAVRENPPELVVSDVMMPQLDGFGLVSRLRADPRTASLPVILLSARAGEEAAVAGLESGADDYLAKPFSARELLARVRTHVELARLRHAWSAELERANRELEAFSYSVSHDLRAPLRQIRSFSQALNKEYAVALDARARGYLDYIVSGAETMAALIDGLLELGRVTRAPLSVDSVDLSELAVQAIRDLQTGDPARVVSVDIAPGLAAHGDRRLLSVVLVNLLGNAWKFSAKTAAAHIQFGRHAAPVPTFFVRDNGAGFDMKYADQLFAPFRRLHDASEFEGTGVGLATVQRAVARHGGHIWVEAAIGRGAAFFFSLPRRTA